MDSHKISITVQKAFGNLYRKRLSLIAVRDTEGRILVGSKPAFYPEDISRMLGGGMDEGEDEKIAALRELEEELNVKGEEESLSPLFTFEVEAKDEEGNEFSNITYVYLYDLEDDNYEAGDDVKQIIPLTVDELEELGKRYEALEEDNWYEGVEGKHSWGDYGKVYGPIHKLTAQKIKELAE